MSANLGRVAYDAYRLRRGGVAYDGTAIPEWDALRPEIREAWRDAAAAVVGARSPQPAGTIDLDAARKTAREARELADKATPGPWHKADCVSPKIVIYAVPAGERQSVEPLYLGETYCDRNGIGRANLAFIAAARSDVPNLAALVLAMAEELDAARTDARVARSGEAYRKTETDRSWNVLREFDALSGGDLDVQVRALAVRATRAEEELHEACGRIGVFLEEIADFAIATRMMNPGMRGALDGPNAIQFLRMGAIRIKGHETE